ncbi:hypothetical protein BH24ACT5_BH24ACT5_18380 [soil metagenome]
MYDTVIVGGTATITPEVPQMSVAPPCGRLSAVMGRSGWPRYDAAHVAGSVSDRMGRILGHINALTAELVDVVKVVGDEDRWHGEGIRSIEHFLQWRTGFTRHHVTQLLKVAASKESHPTVCAHLADGVLTLDQAGVGGMGPAL